MIDETSIEYPAGSVLAGRGALGQRPLYANRLKRAMDVVGASILLLIFLPTMLLVALFVQRDGGPILYRHSRLGARGQTFDCLKFRTMHIDSQVMLENLLDGDPEARAEWDRDFKLRRDPRITPIGRFLRKSSMDELPQLINVLRGDMSLVGPRPIVEKEIARYQDRYEYYKQCRPGLTGLWQVSGRNRTDYRRRVELDTSYVMNWTLATDVVLILKTPLVVLKGDGAY
jgi:exopolysaccharide production protein ExoY